MTTNTRVTASITKLADTAEDTAALVALRARYRESRDLFSPREMAHLRFLRWLVQTGRCAL
jgi:hypothetical protein